MGSEITRRAALKAAPALGLVGAAPLVAGAAEAADPALAAVREWRERFILWAEALDAYEDWDDPEVDRLEKIEQAARERACETVATTPAGLAAQFFLAFTIFGSNAPGTDRNDPNAYHFGHWKSDVDGNLMRSMFAAAHRLAGHEGPGRFLS